MYTNAILLNKVETYVCYVFIDNCLSYLYEYIIKTSK